MLDLSALPREFWRIPTAVAVAATVLGVVLLTRAILVSAVSKGALDIPNARSSHLVPTPRGGGLAIVLVTTAVQLLLALRGTIHIQLWWALAGGGLAVAMVGFADDHRSLTASTRLTVHFAAALWALACLRGLPPLRVGSHVIPFGWAGYPFGALAIVWITNFFNFMDGIDGIAASEAIFVALSGAVLTAATGGNSGVVLTALMFAAACCGFLVWNLPPAKIFLGDVGSGYLGYTLVVLAMATAPDNPVALFIWLILGGAFFVDATVTLVRRTLRGERAYQAHRSHAYQRLARRWGSHGKVTLAVAIVNVIWLLPCAIVAAVHPRYAAAILMIALAPLVVVAVAAGAGRGESQHSQRDLTLP